jgi:hypothetical protein
MRLMSIRRLIRSANSPPPSPGTFRLVAGPHGPRIQDPNGDVLRLRPEPGTASNGDAASVVLGTGNAAILVTAKTAGVVGNALTAAIAIEPDSTALSVAETDGNIVVSSGDKRIMRVTADFGSGAETIEFTWLFDSWSAGFPYGSLERIDGDWSISGQETFIATVDGDFPDEATWPEGVTVVAAPATAAQAIAVDQSALSVNLTLPEGSDGTGSIAGVTAQPLTGGTAPTEGQPGDLLFDDSNLYLRDATQWRTITP